MLQDSFIIRLPLGKLASAIHTAHSWGIPSSDKQPVSHLLLKDSFTRYRICGWQSFSLRIWKMGHLLPASLESWGWEIRCLQVSARLGECGIFLRPLSRIFSSSLFSRSLVTVLFLNGRLWVRFIGRLLGFSILRLLELCAFCQIWRAFSRYCLKSLSAPSSPGLNLQKWMDLWLFSQVLEASAPSSRPSPASISSFTNSVLIHPTLLWSPYLVKLLTW